MLHEPAVELGADHASRRKTRLGLILFFVYAVIYAVFVLLGLFFTDTLGMIVFSGLNLAVVYGFGLILLAFLMGLIYSLVCTRMEDKMNGGVKI
ncbi:MAG: DUF485 domain-containing protein [Bacteroides sp.]|jgi:uncharacterized membrane protein (DUF485 family)|nr:DUF485 domain-containing protein [Bacteroides sp.]